MHKLLNGLQAQGIARGNSGGMSWTLFVPALSWRMIHRQSHLETDGFQSQESDAYSTHRFIATEIHQFPGLVRTQRTHVEAMQSPRARDLRKVTEGTGSRWGRTEVNREGDILPLEEEIR